MLKETGQKKAAYICHSQGFTQMFTSMMAYPAFYRKHMSVCIAFAPVTTMSHHKVDIFKRLADNKMVMRLVKS